MIRVYLIFLFFSRFSPMGFDFVFNFSIKNMSASQHFMEKTSVRTVVGLMHNDCEENFK